MLDEKELLAFADLTALASPSPTTTLPQSQVKTLVGWRNFATTHNQAPTLAALLSRNRPQRQDACGSYLLDFGDPPYPTPNPIYPFTSVDPRHSNSRTDQAFLTRQELLKLRSSLGFSQNALQYMGTFSRERNQPARDWNQLHSRLPDRFDIGMLGMVKPNPQYGRRPRPWSEHGNGGGFKGRGHYKGDAGTIRDLFGLEWVAGNSYGPSSTLSIGVIGYTLAPRVCLESQPSYPCFERRQERLLSDPRFCHDARRMPTPKTRSAKRRGHLGLGASLIDQYDRGSPDADGSA